MQSKQSWNGSTWPDFDVYVENSITVVWLEELRWTLVAAFLGLMHVGVDFVQTALPSRDKVHVLIDNLLQICVIITNPSGCTVCSLLIVS